VIPWDTHNPRLQMSTPFYEYQHNFSIVTVQSWGYSALSGPAFQLFEEFLAQKPNFLLFDSSIMAFYTFSRITLQMGSSWDWLDNCYCKRIMHTTDSYPNYLHALKHMSLTYLLGLDWFSQFDRLSVYDMQNWNWAFYPLIHVAFTRNTMWIEYLD
jgi:hypothetical protein